MTGFVLGLVLVSLGSTMAPQESSGIKIDKDRNAVIIDAKVAPRKVLKDEIYPIEVIACWPHPKGKKAHETVVSIDVKPSDVHKALESLGGKAGKPARGEMGPARGQEVKIFLEIPDGSGSKKISIQRFLLDPKTKEPFPRDTTFLFTGSAKTKVDPTKPEETYGADVTGTLIAIFPVTDETVIQSSLTMKDEKNLKLEVNKDLLPKEGTAVKLILELVK
ncbi:MAG: YdjY domain-containing protein [Gemmataceae bacterium]|jgi:hypothetical protein|nr:YdjY domain-containing protein [Gemmataceae bacterium]